MIAFSSGNVLEAGACGCGPDYWRGDGGRNFILSVKSGTGYCVSKVLVTSYGTPRQITIVMALDSQADIVAVPELYSSAYVPWHSPRRLPEAALAFINAGMYEPLACCAAIAVDIIYGVIDRDYVDYSGTARDCIITSSGTMELNDECRGRILAGGHVLSEVVFEKNDGLPF